MRGKVCPEARLRRSWRFFLLAYVYKQEVKAKREFFLLPPLSSSFLSLDWDSDLPRHGGGIASGQIQARVLGRPIRWQNQHHHSLHVRQIRCHLSGPFLCHRRFVSDFDFSLSFLDFPFHFLLSMKNLFWSCFCIPVFHLKLWLIWCDRP